MSGYRRPSTTAFGPGDEQRFNALEKAFEGTHYPPLDDSTLSKSSDLGARTQSAPGAYAADIPSTDGSSVTSESIEQNPAGQESSSTSLPPHDSLQVDVNPAATRLVTPPYLTQEDSGLPPTPPTMTNSDHNEPRAESLATNVQFADAVRNALHTQTSGISTPGRHIPTSPQTTPPRTSADGGAPPVQSKLLQPLVAHHLRHHPSSRAESFQTARESQTPAPSAMPNTRTPSPEARPAMRQRHTALDGQSRLESSDASIPPVTVSSPPKDAESERGATPTYARQVERPVSPYHNRRLSVDDGDLEKHISYISNEDAEIPLKGGLGGLALTAPTEDAQPETVEQTSAEDLNNAVYRQIQQENVRRHSAMSQLSALPAGIFFLTAEAKDHKLRRTSGHRSLRQVSESAAHLESARASLDGTPVQLKHAKAQIPIRSLESSPLVEKQRDKDQAVLSVEKTRLASDPMTRLTRVAMSGVVAPPSPLGRQQTLRRTSKTARLENSPRQASFNSETTVANTPEDSPRLARLVQAKKAIREFPPNALQNNTSVRRTSLHLDEPMRSISEQQQPHRLTERKLRRFSADLNLDQNNYVRRTSLDTSGSLLPTSPRKSLDARHLYPSTTPLSQSQWSERSDIEVCEAQGVSIYPHNNESLLVVENGSRPSTKDTATPPREPLLQLPGAHAVRGLASDVPIFSARVDEPTPKLGYNGSIFHADSLLTHPRAAPDPPAIMFIPPTPAEELDRELSPDENSKTAVLQSNESILKKIRRFSESYIEQPLFGRSFSVSNTRRPSTGEVETRPLNLSPMWRPRPLWEDDDYSSDSVVDDYDDQDNVGQDRLPPGGDTSSVESKKRRGLLPRNMSVRLPGFRGQGGFLQGNSLGLDRHGTNNRRPYVVRRRSSGGMGSRGSYVTEMNRSRELRRRASDEMLKQMIGGKWIFTLPFSGGRKVQYTGTGIRQFRERISQIRLEKEEREREKRRKVLKDQIQHKKYEGT